VPARARGPRAGDDAPEAAFHSLDALGELGLWEETQRIILMAVLLAEG
jgi:hypothetical protein